MAKHEGVQIKLYAIIYELMDQVKEAMAGLLEPVLKEVITGTPKCARSSSSPRAAVAGCMVTSGRIVRGKVRVRRRKELIYEGVTQSLRRFQDEVNEVRAGMECGIRIEGFNDYQVGDASSVTPWNGWLSPFNPFPQTHAIAPSSARARTPQTSGRGGSPPGNLHHGSRADHRHRHRPLQRP
jgi:hypothetical protein